MAGRICIGCAGFIRKIGNVAFPWGHTCADVPSALSRPSPHLNCARPEIRSWRAQPNLRAIGTLRVDMYLPHKYLKVEFPFISVPFESTSFMILFNVSILIWIIRT